MYRKGHGIVQDDKDRTPRFGIGRKGDAKKPQDRQAGKVEREKQEVREAAQEMAQRYEARLAKQVDIINRLMRGHTWGEVETSLVAENAMLRIQVQGLQQQVRSLEGSDG